MLFYLIMSNYNLIRLLNDIKNNHLFYKWKMNHYRNYMNNIIKTSDSYGPDYVYNCFIRSKLPFVVFRTDDTFYYIDKNNNNLYINKLDKSLTVIDNFNLGHKSSLSFILKYVLSKV